MSDVRNECVYISNLYTIKCVALPFQLNVKLSFILYRQPVWLTERLLILFLIVVQRNEIAK